jgi:tetratricopeptide (TPR) repeat protein
MRRAAEFKHGSGEDVWLLLVADTACVQKDRSAFIDAQFGANRSPRDRIRLPLSRVFVGVADFDAVGAGAAHDHCRGAPHQDAFRQSDKKTLAADLNTVGYAAMARGDLSVAEAYFNRALSLNPQFDRAAWANLQYLVALKGEGGRPQ